MKHPANATLFDHWLAIRHGRRVPDRADLDPVAIRTVLGFTFMLEIDGAIVSQRRYPVCVSGTRLDALFDRGVKQESFLDLWQPRHAAELRSLAETVLDTGQPVVLGGSAAPCGATPVVVEALMLPLRCQGRTHSRLFCSLVPAAIPAWFGFAGVKAMNLSSWRILDPAPPAGPVVRLWAEAPSAVRRRFTVVQGGMPSEAPQCERAMQSPVKLVVANSTDAPSQTRFP